MILIFGVKKIVIIDNLYINTYKNVSCLLKVNKVGLKIF